MSAGASSRIEARLYDARGQNRLIDIVGSPPRRIGDNQLLWVDVVGREPATLSALAPPLGLLPDTLTALTASADEPRVRRFDAYVHIGLRAAEPGQGAEITVVRLDLVAAPNVVVTVRDGPLRAFDHFRQEIEGVTQIGRLDTATFTAALVDSVLAEYQARVEALEREIDDLDRAALTARRTAPVLDGIAAVRTRAALLRRALAPHRQAFAALARPDFAIHERLGRPWPGLLDQLDTTLAAIETTQSLLTGTHGLLMAGVAQRTNETVKVLTILSAVLLPASLVAGIMGMNFDLPLFADTSNFLWVIGAMAALMAVTLAVALLRDRA